MSNKKETNKVIILVIVGLVLAWLIGGFMGGFIGNIFFGIAIFAIIFSGVFGKNALEKTGGISVTFLIGIMIATSAWGQWWQYVIAILVAIFIGNALSNFRPNYKREFLEYMSDLKYSFVSKKDSFSIMFPEKPSIEEGAVLLGLGSRYYYVYDSGLVVTVTDIRSSKKTKKDIINELERWVQATAGADYMTPVAEPDFRSTVDGSPAVVTKQIHSDQSSIRYDAATIKGSKLYIITLNSAAENIELFENFTSSFRFLSK